MGIPVVSHPYDLVYHCFVGQKPERADDGLGGEVSSLPSLLD